MVKAVFFSCILYDQAKLAVIPEGADPEWCSIPCSTAMTDGYNLILNMDFMARLTVDERVFVIAHEVYHIMAMHAARMRKYTVDGLAGYPFCPDLYNIAADAVINKCLVVSMIGSRPKGTVWIEKIRQKNGTDYVVTGAETAEEIYKLLLEQMPQKVLDELAKGKGKEGMGGAAAKAAGGTGGGADDPLGADVLPTSPDPAAGHVNEAEMKAAVQSAAQQAKSQGTLPAGLKRFIDDFLEPQVSWEEILRATIIARSGNDRTTWSRLNRRKLVSPGVGLPRRQGLRTGDIVCAIDTSGSVSEKELRQFLGEVSSILGDMRPEKLTLIWCDAKVDGVEVLDDPEELRVATVVRGAGGGGGTSFIPPFDYVAENEIPCQTFIYLTDGFGPFPTPDKAPYETIWCISSDVKAPFGETIRITY